MSKEYFLAIGVMTGNSLDAVDVVLTKFSEDGEIEDLCFHSEKLASVLSTDLRKLRTVVNNCSGDVTQSQSVFDAVNSASRMTLSSLHEQYIDLINTAIQKLISKAKTSRGLATKYNVDEPDIIGFHGQTCAHMPPSIAKSKDPQKIYTVQLGSGQMLADKSGITVVYDFRSDDLMNGGEGAPLAPFHHRNIANIIKKRGYFPIAFCNAGNTGNISLISQIAGVDAVVSWDCGPFNNFPDHLMRSEKSMDCDQDGQHGRQGRIQIELLEKLFEHSVQTKDGQNFLNKLPPKSSDPEWYKIIPDLSELSPFSFEDRLRTSEYFAAYTMFHSFSLVEGDLQIPNYFALCGGGWKNPLITDHFKGLLNSDFVSNPVLNQHQTIFHELAKKFKGVVCENSDFFGFDGQAMEARIFADAAVSRIMATPFSSPQTTGVGKNCILGLIRFPQQKLENASQKVQLALAKHNSLNLCKEIPAHQTPYWSRCTAGWKK